MPVTKSTEAVAFVHIYVLSFTVMFTIHVHNGKKLNSLKTYFPTFDGINYRSVCENKFP